MQKCAATYMHDTNACTAGILIPEQMPKVLMWVGSPPELKHVGVWVISWGTQGDAPMRQMLSRSLGTAAERGCDECGILACKGKSNATKYTGYIKPCPVELWDDSGRLHGRALGWASGAVESGSCKRPFGQNAPFTVHYLSSEQRTMRDRVVDKEADRLTKLYKNDKDRAASEIDALAMRSGTRGESETAKSGLHYWDDASCHPVAIYHAAHLGASKDAARWVNVRCGVGTQPAGELVLPFKQPKTVRGLLQARRFHFVLRNKPDCIMVDFTTHLGSMSMSEMQLMFEVGVPYYVHDLVAFGVPRAVGVMLLLLRQGMLCFTRMQSEDSQVYKEQLRQGRACMFAYGAVAEYFHARVENGISQFWFTWKLHKLQHLADQLISRGFTSEASDIWVERLMRHKASMAIKCVLVAVEMHPVDHCRIYL